MSMEQITRDAHNALCDATGVWITLHRGDESVELIALPGATTFEQESPGAEAIQFVSRDWIALADRIVIGGVRVKPQRGDTITETKQNGDVFTYEVLPDQESSWKWSDKFGVAIRIFTRQISKSGEGT